MKPLVNGKPEIANVPIVSRIIVSGGAVEAVELVRD